MRDWLAIPYLDFGRDEKGADCWGLVRLARSSLRGDDLPEFAWIPPGDKLALTGAAREVIAAGWRISQPIPASIATVWRFSLMIHVGIVVAVDGMTGVLDTTRQTGPRWQRIFDFERRCPKVVYYDAD